MKKLVWLVCLVFILTLVSVNASDLYVNLISYEPYPVTPGGYFTMEFKAKNLLSTNLNDVRFKLDVDDPFTVEGDEEISYASIEPNKEILFSYRIRVDGDASTGYETIRLRYYYSTNSEKKDYDIYIQAITPTLIISDVKSVPEKINPGETSIVNLKLQNKADFSLKDISVKLDLSSKEIPFAPMDSVTEQKINSLNSRAETKVEFKIITLADAEAKIYKIPVVLDYYDEFGKNYKKDDVISLIVGSTPDLEINLEENKLIVGKEGTVLIKFINKGLGDIKFLNVKLNPSSDYEILSASSVYIGNIDSDDYETIEFKLFSNTQNILILPLIVSYKDTNNQDYTKNINLEIKPYTLEEAKRVGLIKTNTIGYIVLVIIILIVAYMIYRRIKKRRR